jgi:hypothetical protein
LLLRTCLFQGTRRGRGRTRKANVIFVENLDTKGPLPVASAMHRPLGCLEFDKFVEFLNSTGPHREFEKFLEF